VYETIWVGTLKEQSIGYRVLEGVL